MKSKMHACNKRLASSAINYGINEAEGGGGGKSRDRESRGSDNRSWSRKWTMGGE